MEIMGLNAMLILQTYSVSHEEVLLINYSNLILDSYRNKLII